jgi:hypothetical protein
MIIRRVASLVTFFYALVGRGNANFKEDLQKENPATNAAGFKLISWFILLLYLIFFFNYF